MIPPDVEALGVYKIIPVRAMRSNQNAFLSYLDNVVDNSLGQGADAGVLGMSWTTRLTLQAIL